jgi:hypothetical protein
MDLQGLRSVWRERLGPPPKLRSPELVRLSLMWRLQADHHGGLDADVRARLRGRGGGRESDLAPGVKLVREWNGHRHEVTVVDGGYAYGGKTWKSLSSIARSIAGARWNGPRFFGLRGGEVERR